MFLDRHIHLRDLLDQEQSLVGRLRENAAQLIPVEMEFAQLPVKRHSLAKQPCAVIVVKTKCKPPRKIPVVQFSDDQWHTILPTSAILARIRRRIRLGGHQHATGCDKMRQFG